MDNTENAPNVGIDTGNVGRGGVYANISFISSNENESILNFAFIDATSIDENGKRSMDGVLQARIIMSNSGIVDLRNMLDNHIKENFERGE